MIRDTKGNRWMLKFQIVAEGVAKISHAVLKLVCYPEIHYFDGYDYSQDSQDPAIWIGKTTVEKFRLPTGTKEETPQITTLETNQPVVRGENRIEVSSAEADEVPDQIEVLRFKGNGFLHDVEFKLPEAVFRGKDLRFRAILRSDVTASPPKSNLRAEQVNQQDPTRATVGTGSEPESKLGAEQVNQQDRTRATVGTGPKPESMHNPSLGNFDYVLPIFYLKQPEGYLLVAELIKDIEKFPTIRQFLVSVFITSPSGESKQQDIYSPRFDVEDIGELYTIGFHQDLDNVEIGEKPPAQRFEFLFGREDNYAQFAVFDLPSDVEFAFKTNGKVRVGVGCWPKSETQTLYYHGDIKEIICDPWSECTRC